MVADFSVEGDLTSLEMFAKNFTVQILRETMQIIQAKFLLRAAEEFKEELNNAFSNTEQFGFEPLSEEWAKEKSRKGFSDSAWKATETLINNIQIVVSPEGSVSIGWDDTPHPENGEPLNEIAAALEFGVADRNIPERPILRPVAQRVKEKLQGILAVIVREEIDKALVERWR